MYHIQKSLSVSFSSVERIKWLFLFMNLILTKEHIIRTIIVDSKVHFLRPMMPSMKTGAHGSSGGAKKPVFITKAERALRHNMELPTKESKSQVL